ncbi:MAG: DUF721 domain-containing protein [Leptolyngbya sp. SIO1E4]|nr:DUF721 domain-containing protein [Leptolyngbya sp. SIO1E4]
MQSLQTLMQQLERSPRWQASASFRQLLTLWPQLVGTAVAQHSWPHQVQRGILHVSVSSAAWAQTLTFERCRILEKLHRQIPATVTEIQELRFATARWRQTTQRSRPLASPQLREHPSWAQVPQRQATLSPNTADDAFHGWSQRLQRQLADQSLCPECQRPCPTQELQRWPACAICMTHHWQTSTAK